MTAPYEAVLFDFDGVLADTEPVHFACWVELVRPFGIRLEWPFYEAHGVGVTDREMLARLAAVAEPPVALETLLELYPRKKALFRHKTLQHPPITAEVKELLRSLTAYKLGVVSSTDRSNLDPMLEAAGVRDCFGVVVGGDDVRENKPAPEPYLLAAQKLGANRVLVVEDSEAGLASGRAAGFEVLRIPQTRETPALVRAALGLGNGSARP